VKVRDEARQNHGKSQARKFTAAMAIPTPNSTPAMMRFEPPSPKPRELVRAWRLTESCGEMPLHSANGVVALPMVSHDANSFVPAEKFGASFCGRGLVGDGW